MKKLLLKTKNKMGSNQIAEVTKMSNNSSSVRFTFNFVNKTIVGSKASFDKARKGFGPIYNELVVMMEKQPTFGFEVKVPKQPAKVKQTYKGMDIAFIRDYLTAVGNRDTLKKVDDVIAFAEADGRSKYPLAKRVFFDAYENFNYVEAKSVVDEYRHQLTLKMADEMAAKLAAIAA